MSLEGPSPQVEQLNLHAGETPARLKKTAEKLLQSFIKEKKVEGREHLTEIPPDRRVVIVSSHFSNLDGPLIIDTFGDGMNLQLAAMSTHFDITDVRNFMMSAVGKESFSPISYRRRNEGAMFNPDDFTTIQKVTESENKVPWITAHNLKKDREMSRANVGSAYLAEKLNALVIPVAIVLEGSGASMEGAGEILKAFKDKLSATVRIGVPLEVPRVDAGFVESIMRKRKCGEMVTSDEKRKFSETVYELHKVADMIGADIARMLPPEEKGFYGKKSKAESVGTEEEERH